MANFGTDTSLRPLDNSTITDRPAGPMLNVGEIARDYSERGRAVENAVNLGAQLVDIQRQNEYNTEMPKIRQQMLQAEQTVTADPADYSTAKTSYDVHYASILDSLNKSGLDSSVIDRLKHDTQGMYMTGQYRVNQFWKQNLTRDTAANSDNNVDSIIKSTAGTGPDSVPYMLAQQNISDTYLPLAKPNSDGVSFLTAAQAQESVTSGKQKLALGDVDVLLKSNPNKAISLIGKSYKSTAYKDLSPEQWTAAYAAGQRIIKQYQAQQTAGTMQKLQGLVEANINAGSIDDKAAKVLINSLPDGSAAKIAAQQYVVAGHQSIDVNTAMKGSTFQQMAEYVKLTQDAAKTTDPTKVTAAISLSNIASSAYQKQLQNYSTSPNEYVSAQPSVQAAITASGYAPGTPGYVQAGVRAFQTWDRQNGVTTPTPLIDSQEAAIIRAKYDSSPGNAQGVMQSLEKAYGPAFAAIQSQLYGTDAKPGILPKYAAALDNNADPSVIAGVHALAATPVAALRTAAGDPKKSDVTKYVNDNVTRLISAFGPAMISSNVGALIEKTAYGYMASSPPKATGIEQAITLAANNLYFNNYQFTSDGTAFPKNIAHNTTQLTPQEASGEIPFTPKPAAPNTIEGIQHTMSETMQNIPLYGHAPGSQAEFALRQQYLSSGGSHWMYQPDNQSWTWVTPSGAAIKGANNQPITLSLSNLSGKTQPDNSPAAIMAEQAKTNAETSGSAGIPSKKEAAVIITQNKAPAAQFNRKKP